MGWLAGLWAGFRGASPETRRMIGIAALVALGLAAVVWLRLDAADDAEKKIENDYLKGRIENIEDAREKHREIENMSDDDLGAAIDGLPQRDRE